MKYVSLITGASSSDSTWRGSGARGSSNRGRLDHRDCGVGVVASQKAMPKGEEVRSVSPQNVSRVVKDLKRIERPGFRSHNFLAQLPAF
jgi:hypothetical protein